MNRRRAKGRKRLAV
ncbi:MAG: hypothetical protein DRG34_06175 [Deltaproteobacteria bacterium]|nr:MAG: hypothetical protein DRG34_06175 [Deltaproteobacteria bacterium]